jgi:predicted CXXCH cytochrome family protein
MRRIERVRALVLGSWLVMTTVSAACAFAGDISDAGLCARCHDHEAALAADARGHAPLVDCISCHEDRRPGRFGRGHRAVPTSCTSHHTAVAGPHPPKRTALGPARLRRNCLKCHDPHGSTNAHLIRTDILARRAFRPIDFHASGGAVSGGFADPTLPGHGLCEVCHQKTDFYKANGHDKAHFTVTCTACHDHAVSFRPVVTEANCTICHADEATRLAKPSLHNANFTGKCTSCHAEAKPDPGPGHRAISACTQCHAPADIMTHMPPGVAPLPCTQCHDPHGSDNIELVRDVTHTPQGLDQPIHFIGRGGKADGSFVSVSAPGSGVCETCHTTTQFYRADGTGAAHFTLPCFPCHTHGKGFARP